MKGHEIARVLASEYLFEVLRSPHISEKSMRGSELGQYAFRVATSACKKDVKRAVEMLYPEVSVVSVNSCMCRGKTKFVRGVKGRRAAWKKAVVTLKKGQVLEIVGQGA